MEEQKTLITERVHHYYWDYDLNCATTMLKILAEIYKVNLDSQVLYAALGMHGAGKRGDQCGLVEGSLMFIGVYGKVVGIPDDGIIDNCCDFAEAFSRKFGSLLCRELRPQGFSHDNPPHLCEMLTVNAVCFAADFVEKMSGKEI